MYGDRGRVGVEEDEELEEVRLWLGVFASIEYVVVLLDSMGDYRLSLGFHTKVGGSGKTTKKENPESLLTERTNPENPSYVVTGVSRKQDYEIVIMFLLVILIT